MYEDCVFLISEAVLSVELLSTIIISSKKLILSNSIIVSFIFFSSLNAGKNNEKLFLL